MVEKPTQFFHYQPLIVEHVKSLLRDSKVKFSQPGQFNDPWDCRPHWRMPQNSAELKTFKRYLDDILSSRSPTTSAGKRALLIASKTATSDDIKNFLSAHEIQMFNQINTKYRVYALTEAADSVLMWSHYGRGHTGICLEFDSSAYPFSGAAKVEYLAEYPAFDITSEGYRALLTKAKSWEYEKEWRLIAEEIAPGNARATIKAQDDFVTFDPAVLKSITVGAISSHADRNTLIDLVKKFRPDVIVRQAEIESEKYAIRIVPPI